MTIPLLNTVLVFVVLAQTLFALLYLLCFKAKSSSTLLFGLFLVSMSSCLIDHLILAFHPNFSISPRFFFTPTGFYFFTAPLFYLYYSSLFEKVDKKNIFLILLPGIFEFLFMVIIFCLPLKYSIPVKDNFRIYFDITYAYLLPVFSIFFFIKILLKIKKYHQTYLNFFSNTQKVNLKWMQFTTFFLLFNYTSQIIIVSWYMDKSTSDYAFLFNAVTNLFLIHWLMAYGVKQEHIPAAFCMLHNDVQVKEPELKVDYEWEKREFEKIQKQVQTSKCYKSPNLTVIDVAELTNKHPKKVSRLINQYANQNFNKYINKYRVEEAKKLLLDPDFENLTIEAIAEQAGFKTRSVFNTFFKTETGYTPKDYIKKKNALC